MYAHATNDLTALADQEIGDRTGLIGSQAQPALCVVTYDYVAGAAALVAVLQYRQAVNAANQACTSSPCANGQ
jgi:hypothetical protein